MAKPYSDKQTPGDADVDPPQAHSELANGIPQLSNDEEIRPAHAQQHSLQAPHQQLST